MAVYVDDLFATSPSREWPYPCAAHLVGDTEEELHRFAATIGLHRRWFQGTRYDLTALRRLAAVKAGAVQVSQRRMAKLLISLNPRSGAATQIPYRGQRYRVTPPGQRNPTKDKRNQSGQKT